MTVSVILNDGNTAVLD